MKYNIALFGAFDVSSFGDSMFPKAAHIELSKFIQIDNLFTFSPIGNSNSYNDNGCVYPYEKFKEIVKQYKIDAIIVGGGELLHNQTIEFEDVERNEVLYKPGEIWQFPAMMGQKYNIPVFFNSVGMPYEFSKNEKKKCLDIFSNVKYVSLRDRFSYKRFLDIGVKNCSIIQVPDSLWRVKDYFDSELLNKSFIRLNNEFGFFNKKYIAFQYGMTRGYEQCLDVLQEFCRQMNYQMIVFAINACHKDFDIVQSIENNERSIVIKRILKPEEIIALISNSYMFVGTSLHGNLVARAYNVKNIIIDMYPQFVSKMDGLSAMLQTDKNYVNNVNELWTVLQNNNVNSIDYTEIIDNARKEVEDNFRKICDIIQNNSLSEDSCICYENWTSDEYKPFYKGYYEIWDEYQLVDYGRAIGVLENGYYYFEFNLEGKIINSQNKVLVNIPIAHPCSVKIKNSNVEILSDNSIGDNIFIDETVLYSIKQIAELSSNLIFECSIDSIELSDLMENVWDKYRDSQLHIQQLQHKEQRYNHLTYNQEEIINSQKKQIDDFEKQIAFMEHELTSKSEALQNLQKEHDSIVQSKMYSIMHLLCIGMDTILIIPKYIWTKIYSFCKMIKHVNIAKLKIAFGYLQHEGVKGTYKHLMRDYHQGQLKKIELDLKNEPDRIRSLDECKHLSVPACEKPLVSIVIPVYNQFTFTYYCIDSIIRNSGNIDYEIIIADDCSTDLTVDLEKIVDNINIIRNQSNLMFLKNCNNAAKEAKGKYILFLNNDTQVQKDWLKPLVDICERDESVGMVGSKLVYSDGTLQEAGGIIWSDGSGWNYGRNDDAMKPEYNYVKEADYISGASIMIRRLLWEQLGGFDELFVPAYYEDTDLAFQVRNAGYKVIYQPLSVVVHFEGKSNGTELNSGVKKYQVENRLKFKKKWKEILETEQYANGQNVYLAKDRSQLKKRILVIDHYVPHYDKDAGSRCTYMYLKMFLRLGLKVTFIGDNFFQHEPYTTELTQMGIEILYGEYYSTHWQEWLKDNLHYFDYIYLQRPHISIKYIDIVKQYAKGKIFYYAVDLHYLRLTREYELNHNPKVLEEAEAFRKDEFYLFDKADVIHVVGSYEQEVLQKELPGKIVRNIPIYIFESLLTDIEKDFSKRQDILFVGGFGHTPNIGAVLWFAKEIYPKILQVFPNMKWHIVGGGAPKEVTNLANENIVIEGFLTDEELNKMYRKCRMAVVPLRVGAGVKGKVVEAAYYQIPLVTTSIGEEGISNVEGAFVVEDDADKMAQLIIELYNDFEKLRHMSDAGIELIRNHYMLDEAERVLKQDL